MLYEVVARPDLDGPVLVVGLEGWIDAGLAAARAMEAVQEALRPRTVAVFDADVLLDHRARRPALHLRDGVNTGLTWPTIELRAGSDGAGNDVLLLVGAEPDHLWRAFTAQVVDLAVELGTRLVLGLGAYPAPAPHTRPSLLAATATTPELADRVGYVKGSLDFPGGVEAAIERRCAEIGLPAMGLWAQVPHYAVALPYPPAALALVKGLREVGGLVLPLQELEEAALATRARLDALVANSAEHVELVRQLEAQVDALDTTRPGRDELTRDGALPSGDELAEELQRFLREQGGSAT